MVVFVVRKILAPHKEQDGWRYLRAPLKKSINGGETPIKVREFFGIDYDDSVRGSRIISSRRVEEAVETWDYLKRCKEEGLAAHMLSYGMWIVASPEYFLAPSPVSEHHNSLGSTLREAYWRYKNGLSDEAEA